MEYRNTRSIYSLWSIFLQILVMVIVCEAIIMYLLQILQLRSLWTIIIDPILLALFITPILYKILIKPISFALAKSIESEEALKKNENRFRTIVENVNDAIIIFDFKGNIFDVNDNTCSMFGYSRSELVGGHLSMIDSPKNPPSANRVEQLMNNGSLLFEGENIRKDGSSFPVEISAKVVSHEGNGLIQGFVRDITERKKAEEALQQNNALFKALLNSTRDGILIVDSQGKKLLQNQRSVELWNIPQHIADNPDDNLQREYIKDMTIDPEKFIENVEYFFNHPDEISNDEVELKNGTILEGYSAPVLGKESKYYGRIWTFNDITERKKLEAQLQQTQKIESIGTLAGGIAHDFNNILSPIMIHSEMVMDELPDDSPLQFNAKEILKSCERARDMVKQILAFGRQKQQERIAIRLGSVLNEVLKLVRSTTPTTIDIRHNIKTKTDTVVADPTQIHQVILNLCTNASHATREKGGVIGIEIDELLLNSEAIVKYDKLVPGIYLRLTVRDTGHGIPSDIIGKIFDPYFTTKEVGEGSGMGLAVAHGIVKSHGGDITVDSEPGKGTTFYVLLPKSESDISPVKEHKIELPRGTERILFVDDEKPLVDILQPMLEKLGYKMTARTSSIEALEAFRNNPQAFDLVITDMTMPNMTGKDLAKELMSIRPDIPIILCTGFSEQIDEYSAKEMGIRAYVMKPIVGKEIANTIREVLDKK